MEYITRFGEPEKFTSEIKERLRAIGVDVPVKCNILQQNGCYDYEILTVKIGEIVKMDLRILGNQIIASVQKTPGTKILLV